MMDSLAKTVLTLFSPVLYIFMAAVSLLQFRNVYIFLGSLVSTKSKNEHLEFVRQVSKRIFGNIESILGPPNKVSINFTHVLLVALMLVFATEMANLRQSRRRKCVRLAPQRGSFFRRHALLPRISPQK